MDKVELSSTLSIFLLGWTVVVRGVRIAREGVVAFQSMLPSRGFAANLCAVVLRPRPALCPSAAAGRDHGSRQTHRQFDPPRARLGRRGSFPELSPGAQPRSVVLPRSGAAVVPGTDPGFRTAGPVGLGDR